MKQTNFEITVIHVPLNFVPKSSRLVHRFGIRLKEIDVEMEFFDFGVIEIDYCCMNAVGQTKQYAATNTAVQSTGSKNHLIAQAVKIQLHQIPELL
uniref:Uncharacterized protein n=1 Tax=Romanomermis culicivorax TaxID=13658 RepID=A0A915KXF2_ROMCU